MVPLGIRDACSLDPRRPGDRPGRPRLACLREDALQRLGVVAEGLRIVGGDEFQHGVAPPPPPRTAKRGNGLPPVAGGGRKREAVALLIPGEDMDVRDVSGDPPDFGERFVDRQSGARLPVEIDIVVGDQSRSGALPNSVESVSDPG